MRFYAQQFSFQQLPSKTIRLHPKFALLRILKEAICSIHLIAPNPDLTMTGFSTLCFLFACAGGGATIAALFGMGGK
jgi:hypothetical protein